MESYNLNIRKIKSPKSKRNNDFLLKEYKKSLNEKKPLKSLKHKKIKILSKKKSKKKSLFDIPTELSINKNIISPIKDALEDVAPVIKKTVDDTINEIKPVIKKQIDPLIKQTEDKLTKNTEKKIIKKKTKRKKNKYKEKTISVKMKKNKEKDIDDILKKINNMNLDDLQKNLKSKGINSKIKNKNKLLKYMYLLTCVDDNINIIKG